jgi:protein-tyrosine-phosphatase
LTLNKTILFVCVANAGRSQMAESIFNQMNLAGFRAISAGTNPAKEINPLVVGALREIGIDASASKPKQITPEMVAEADRIITMGCEASGFCPAKFLPKIEDWHIGDPEGKSLSEIRSIRDTIRWRVQKLVRDLH